jgi:hypothetical protein
VNASPPHKGIVVAYFLLGQVCWFACVLGAAAGRSLIGIGVCAILVALHLLRVARPREELKLLAAVMVIGGTWESVVIRCGLLTYPTSTLTDGLAPAWLFALWVSFAAQFNTTYAWLKTRIPAAALLGVIAGPLSFRAGAALGALHFAKPIPAAVTLGLGWAVLLPVITMLSRRWDGVSNAPTAGRYCG